MPAVFPELPGLSAPNCTPARAEFAMVIPAYTMRAKSIVPQHIRSMTGIRMAVSIRLVPLRLLRNPARLIRCFIRSPPIEAYLEEQRVPIVRKACFVSHWVMVLEFHILSASCERVLVLCASGGGRRN